MASYGHLQGILTGLTKSTDHPNLSVDKQPRVLPPTDLTQLTPTPVLECGISWTPKFGAPVFIEE